MIPGGSNAVASPRRRPGEEDECGDNRAGGCWVRDAQFPSHQTLLAGHRFLRIGGKRLTSNNNGGSRLKIRAH